LSTEAVFVEVDNMEATTEYKFRILSKSIKSLLSLGYYDNSVLVIDEAIKRNTKSVDLLNLKAKVLTMGEHYQKCILVYDKILKIDKKNSNAWLRKATCYDILKDKKKAAYYYDQFFKLKPKVKTEKIPAFYARKREETLFDLGNSQEKVKVKAYFRSRDNLPEVDKLLCDLFMVADHQMRDKLKTAFPEMYREFLNSEQGIYKIIRYT
jgi:tetratricopeptide (TPR) repeat protein